MRDYSKRRTDTSRIVKKLSWVALLLVITVAAMRAAWGMYGKFAEAAASDEIAQKQLATLQEQQAQVAESVDSFKTPRGLEAQVRERYGVVKPGEGQIQIVRDSTTTVPSTAPQKSLMQHIWQALFGWL